MAYVPPVAADLVARFPTFAAVPTATITTALGDAAARVDDTWTAADYALGLMLYAAHSLTLDGQGTSAEAALGAAGALGFSSLKSRLAQPRSRRGHRRRRNGAGRDDLRSALPGAAAGQPALHPRTLTEAIMGLLDGALAAVFGAAFAAVFRDGVLHKTAETDGGGGDFTASTSDYPVKLSLDAVTGRRPRRQRPAADGHPADDPAGGPARGDRPRRRRDGRRRHLPDRQGRRGSRRRELQPRGGAGMTGRAPAGLDAARRRLARLPATMRGEAQEALRRIGADVVAEARHALQPTARTRAAGAGEAPADPSGDLAASLTASVDPATDRLTNRLGSPHAADLEFGTRRMGAGRSAPGGRSHAGGGAAALSRGRRPRRQGQNMTALDRQQPLVTAIVGALLADASLASLVGTRIYDAPPGRATMPGITIKLVTAADRSSADTEAQLLVFDLDVWDRYALSADLSRPRAIMAAIRRVLHMQPLAIPAVGLVLLRCTGAQGPFRDPDTVALHGIVTVSARPGTKPSRTDTPTPPSLLQRQGTRPCPLRPARACCCASTRPARPLVTAGGLRSKQVKRSVAKVDVTTADSAGHWQELLPGAAVQSMTFAASDFLWLNDVAYQSFKTAFEAGTMLVCQIVYPGSGYYQGNFVITQLDEQAPFDKEISSALTIESSQVPVWATGAPS